MAISKFEKVKGYYEYGFWSLNRVRDAVIKEWITEGEYYKITGKLFEDDNSNT